MNFFIIVFSNFIRKIQKSCILYILHQPLGLKQNTVIKNMLGEAFLNILRYSPDSITQISLSALLIRVLYRINIKIMLEIVDLLMFRSFNPLKKRYDRISMATDQLVLACLLFALCAIIYTNLFVFYFFFTISELLINLFVEINNQFYYFVCKNKQPNFRLKNNFFKDILLGKK